MQRFLNPSILLGTIPVLEAKASCEIENIRTTIDQVFRFIDKPKAADSETKEVLRCLSSIFRGIEAVNDGSLSFGTPEIVCSVLRGSKTEVRKKSGTFIGNPARRKVVYTPPSGEDVIKQKLDEWENFIANPPDTDPLIMMALMHYQFEAIHPFTDGNGRTGRVLNILFLVQAGLLDLPVLCLSRYIVQHKSDYYRCLLGVTKARDWESWIKFMLRAVEETAEWTKNKVLAIRRLESETIKQMKATPELKKIYSRELVDLVFSLPYIRIQNLVDNGLVKRQSASKYLKLLTEHEILSEQKTSKEKLFVNQKLIDLLSAD